MKNYPMTLQSNNYVQPFTMFGSGRISDEDLKKYGAPISINVVQGTSAPCSGVLRWNSSWNGYQYLACANVASVTAIIVFLKLN